MNKTDHKCTSITSNGKGFYFQANSPVSTKLPYAHQFLKTGHQTPVFSMHIDESASGNQYDDPLYRVAKWFLHKSPLSNKKLQKLCYYTYAWFVVFFNDPESVSNKSNVQTLSCLKFQAWVHGPVCPELYHMYKQYGWADIPQKDMAPVFPPEILDLIEQVWSAYGDLSADQLESLSHSESPWQKARGNCKPGDPCTTEISPLAILQYYSALR